MTNVGDKTSAEALLDRATDNATVLDEAALRRLLADLPVLVLILEPDLTVRYTNAAFSRRWGNDPDEVAGSDLLSWMHPEDAARAAAVLGEVADRPGARRQLTLRYRTQDGRWRWVEATATNLAEVSEVEGILVTATDVTERTREALRYDSALDQLSEGFVVFDSEGQVLFHNTALIEVLDFGGEPSKSAFDDRAHRGIDEDGRPFPPGQRPVERALRGEEFKGLVVGYRRQDEHLVWLRVSASQVSVEGERLTVLSGVDITDRKEMEHQLRASEQQFRHLALHDPLTGLANRTLVFDRLDQALVKRGASVGLLVIDVDQFKEINDTHGHPAGDEVLSLVARRLEGVVRPSDTVGRYAGDEFVVVCPDLDGPHQLEAVAERARRALAETMLLGDGNRLAVSASIGGAAQASDGGSRDELLRAADAALYEAKDAGRNQTAIRV